VLRVRRLDDESTSLFANRRDTKQLLFEVNGNHVVGALLVCSGGERRGKPRQCRR
jgi:hypothetical protein